MSLNKAMLIGHVGQDPTIRYVDNNSSNGSNAKVASFTLATTERYRDRSGNLQENTEWHNIVAWRGLADTAENYVKKGSQLYIEGRIRTRSYTDQAGQKRYTTEIVADTLQLLGRRQDREGDNGTSQPQGGYSREPRGAYQSNNVPAGFTAQRTATPTPEPDDLPF